MNAQAREPRLTSGFVLSVMLHGGLVAAFITLRPGAAPPSAPVFKVQLIAAPAAEPSVVTAPTPAAPPKPTPEVKKVPPKTVTPPKPRAKTPVAAPTPAPQTTPTPPPPSVATGRGSDVANLVTAGIDFPYPAYINRIANEIIREFNSINTNKGALRATVSFTIRRDGSVSPESIHLVTTSGVYSFNQDALAAVEAAANRNAFGPLPPGFREDILPVRFTFDPVTIRR